MNDKAKLSLSEVETFDDLSIGDRVIHTSTLEVGKVVKDGLNKNVAIVDYGDGVEYPQPLRNVMLITKNLK